MPIPITYVNPAINEKVRGLCRKPYPGHRKGCPNFGKRPTCPPAAPLLPDFFDLSKPVLAVYVSFNLAQHREQMRTKHPEWSRRQLDCCLYWQGGAKKRLKDAIEYNLTRRLLFGGGNLVATDCPEAMGVNVTETMRKAGVVLEWPPENIVIKVAFIGVKPDGKD